MRKPFSIPVKGGQAIGDQGREIRPRLRDIIWRGFQTYYGWTILSLHKH